MEGFYNPKCAVECLFSKGSPRNWNDGKECIRLRLYEIPFLGYDSVIEDDNKLSEVDNFRRRIALGTKIIICARKIGKTFIGLIASILLKLIHYSDKEMTMASYDEKHVEKVLDAVKEFIVSHNFFKSYKRRIRGSPEYEIQTENGNMLFGINETVKGKNPGEAWWGHHTFINFQDEIQAETDNAYEKKIDAVSDFGVMEILCGIPLINKASPLGRLIRDRENRRSLIRLPQYVSSLFDEHTKKKRIRAYGGLESLGYRINVAADLIEDAYGVFDMERVKSNYNKKRIIKHFEITNKTFKHFKNTLVLEPIYNSSKTYVVADIGDTAETEISVIGKIEGKYQLVYNITTYRLSLTKELPEVIEHIFRRVGGHYCSVDCCFDDKTEILTNKGWKKYNTISKSDKVFSLNPETGIANYENIDFIYINKNYDGIMYNVDNKINFLITPEHKLLTHKHNHTKKWELTKINDLVDSNIERFYMKQDCKWKGFNKKYIKIKGKEKKNINKFTTLKFNMNDWLEFLGWFISEGSLYYDESKYSYGINICQTKRKGRKEIEKILKKLNIDFYYSGDSYKFNNKIIATHLLSNCYLDKDNKKCWNKKVPEYVKILTPNQIKCFLLSYCKGDGTFNKDNSKTYYTTSKQLADDIQELILKTGNKSSLRTTNNEGFKDYNHLPLYRIQEFKETGRTVCVYNKNIKKIKYKGIIWCVETNPHHTIFVRRNGKVYWSGNTIMGKAVYEILCERLNEKKLDEKGNLIKLIKRVYWCAFNEDIVTGFEKDDEGNLIKDGKNQYVEKKEPTLHFAVTRLQQMFFDKKFDIPSDDFKFDLQFSSYISMISGNKIIYDTTSEDHYVQSFEVFAILLWLTEGLPYLSPADEIGTSGFGVW